MSGAKRKNYFKSQDSTKRRSFRDASKERGCKAILCTSDVNKQRQVVRESLDILNRFTDILYPTSNNEDEEGTEGNLKTGGDDDTLDQLIEKEKKALMDPKKQRFVPLETGVKGVTIFKVNSEEIDPCKLVSSIMNNVKDTKELHSRTLNRMIPLQITTYPSIENIKEYAAPIIKAFLEERGAKSGVSGQGSVHAENSDSENNEETKNKSLEEEGKKEDTRVCFKWGVAYKKRNNTSFPKMEAINAIAELVGPDHKVNLTDQDFTIILEVFQSVCGLSIVDNYHEFKRFNLRSLISEEKNNEDTSNT